MPAVVRVSRGRERHVYVTELLVCRHRRPRGHVANDVAGAIAPAFAARLARRGNEMKLPDQLSRVDVVAANILRSGFLLRAAISITAARLTAAVTAHDNDIA